MSPTDRQALEREVVELTRALIRIDTSNPPGGETAAARMLFDYMSAAGAECELAGPDPERLNLIARIRGAGEGPSLMLMGHTDVVPAPAGNWTVDPFEGVVRDGTMFGRGVADMKGELAARAVAVARLARSGEVPAGDVVLIAESDEERNDSGAGMVWLVRERPDLRCDFALNEGGGMLLELAGGRRVVTISVGEKLVSSIRLRVSGAGGHASIPVGADNPLRGATAIATRLLEHRFGVQVVPAVARSLQALGAPSPEDASFEAWAAAQHPELAGALPAMVRPTITPTGLEAGEPPNVIPPFADVICDCRLMPGSTQADLHALVAQAVGDDVAYELEVLEPLEGGTESAIDTPLFEACEAFVRENVPGAEILPVIGAGFSDSYFVRRDWGTTAYGFAPVFSTDIGLYTAGFHAADERLDIADLVAMTDLASHAIDALSRSARS